MFFEGINGQANLKKRLDLEIKAVDKEIGQNAYFVKSHHVTDYNFT